MTGTNGTSTDTATLTVTNGALASIVIAPHTASVSADATQSYTAEGFDAHGNDIGNVTAGTTFSISGSGSCTGADCGSTTPGSYTVTGTNGTSTDTATLTVTNGALASIVIAPHTASVSADATQSYTAEGFDAHGNDIGNVTAGTTFSISGSGSCTGADCGSTTPGSYTVTGTNGTSTDTATLTVTNGALASIVIAPHTASVSTDATQGYTAEGFDAHGNDIGNVTAGTTFSISGSGSCTGADCGSTTPGSYTVTGTNGTSTDTATLTVTNGALASIVIAPHTASVSTDATQAYTAEGFDAHGNDIGNVTAGTTFSISGSGSCTGADCGSTTPGTYTVTAPTAP